MNQINLLLLQSEIAGGLKVKKPGGFTGSISRPLAGWPWLLVCREKGRVGSTPRVPAAAFTEQLPSNIYSPQTGVVWFAEGM